MVSMRNITNRHPDFANVFPMKRNGSYTASITGGLQSLLLLAMTRVNVPHVAPRCWCWRFTTKKLHCLNDIRKLWDMDKSTPRLFLNRQTVQSPTFSTKTEFATSWRSHLLRSFAMQFLWIFLLYTIFPI